MVNVMIDPASETSMEYKYLKPSLESKVWIQRYSNKMRLFTNYNRSQMITQSNTIHFINPSRNSTDHKRIYIKIVCKKKPRKEVQKYNVCFTVYGNRINYPEVVIISTAELQQYRIQYLDVLYNRRYIYIYIYIYPYTFRSTLFWKIIYSNITWPR